MNEPETLDELNGGYLSFVAGKMLGDPDLEVTSFQVTPDPFEFPRFGEKDFYEIGFAYRCRRGAGRANLILRVMPPMDAVMMITGDTEHRELKAFETGLYGMVPAGFHVPYVHVIDRPEREQYWAFLEDVRPEMEALGMHSRLPDGIMRAILSHLAEFHAAFWERRDIIQQPWLMSLRRPVDYFYRCIVDILDGLRSPAQPTEYILERWPWLSEGVVNLMSSLEPGTRRAIEHLYRNPEPLISRVEAMPMTLCHYDFDNRNLGLRDGRDGRQTVVIDWEILGGGISCADVIRFLMYQQPPNEEELKDWYLDELERFLGREVDRELWREGSELQTIAEWQIRGVLFGVMVNAPSAPVPDEQRPAMRERVFSDIAHVESLVRKSGLA